MQAKKSVSAQGGLSPLRRRNRQALIDAAQAFLAEGRTPTLSEAADRAEISRATAYRYFSTSEQLQNEAALDAVAKAIPHGIQTGGGRGRGERQGDGVGAVLALVDRIEAMVRVHEPAFRTMLRLSLEAETGSRAGRRVGWIDACLDGSPVPEPVRARLIPALALLCGIEARIVMKDVCGLDDEAARETILWATQALLAHAFPGGVDDRAADDPVAAE
ncbi:hypothetical protein [Salinarimonas chemoclinalis]|uniref:hypothetical protein n=1 Tax=Salinarimonas chemoclinalis TaxID=3241599 RepID=UPI0035585DDE